MNNNEVTITKTEYKRLLECEDDARRLKHRGCMERIEPSNLQKIIIEKHIKCLERNIEDIKKLCNGFTLLPLKDKIVGDPFIFIECILKRVVEIADRKDGANDCQ